MLFRSLTPLALFVLVAAFAFKSEVFARDLWGQGLAGGKPLGSVLEQVSGAMLVTVWVFVGIEGASVYSARAERRADVGRATLIGFVLVLALLVAVSVLSMGILSQPELAALPNPSMAHVLAHVAGP